MELLDKLMTGELVKHNGSHYELETTGFAPSIQRPRAPIWVAGQWPGTKPFRRAAKWDGVVPMSQEAMEGHTIEPGELAKLMDYIAQHRPAAGPFESVHLSASDGPPVQELTEAGATWFIACAAPGDTVESVRERPRNGSTTS